MPSTQVSPSGVTVKTAGMHEYVIWIMFIPVYCAFSKENTNQIVAMKKKKILKTILS